MYAEKSEYYRKHPDLCRPGNTNKAAGNAPRRLVRIICLSGGRYRAALRTSFCQSITRPNFQHSATLTTAPVTACRI